ncbi:MAG TPA: class I SAM-dependent methyltransferase [Candidatus Binatia bacterium]
MNTLALSGGFLAVVAVGTVYFLQSHWIWQAYWWFLQTRTHRALILASVLLLLAFVLKRFSARISARANFLLRATAIGFLFISGAFIITSAVEIKSKVEIERIPTDAKYKFTFDGVSTNAKIWSTYLREFSGKPNVAALEIGSYEGRSALWFLANILTHDTSSITCVDLFGEDIDSTFNDNVKASGFAHKLTKLKGDSKVVVRNLKNNFDFVYIDGSHIAKDVLIDAVLAWDLLKPGGIMIFDDYGFVRAPSDNQSQALVPKPAIDAFLLAFHHHIDVLHQDYQVIVKKKVQPDLESEEVWVKLKSLFF